MSFIYDFVLSRFLAVSGKIFRSHFFFLSLFNACALIQKFSVSYSLTITFFSPILYIFLFFFCTLNSAFNTTFFVTAFSLHVVVFFVFFSSILSAS